MGGARGEVEGLWAVRALQHKTLLCGSPRELISIPQNPSWHCSFSWLAITHYGWDSPWGPWRGVWPPLQEAAFEVRTTVEGGWLALSF